MPKAINCENIVLHCSAGFGNKESIEHYWYNILGWKNPGYHVLIERDGTKHYLQSFDKNTNGVIGFNSTTLHICYVGGVKKDNVNIAEDNRTPEQNAAIEEVIQEMLCWLKNNGKDITINIGIVGHRDFSPDKNGDGVIAKYERIKECPSFDVLGTTWHYLYSSKDRYNKLPYL